VYGLCHTPPETLQRTFGKSFSIWPDASAPIVGFLGRERFVKAARTLTHKHLVIFDTPAATATLSGVRLLDSKPLQDDNPLEDVRKPLNPFWAAAFLAPPTPIAAKKRNFILAAMQTDSTDVFVGTYQTYLYSVAGGKDSYERRAARVGFVRVIFGEWSVERLQQLWDSFPKAVRSTRFCTAAKRIKDFLESERGAVYRKCLQDILEGADIDATAEAAGFAAFDFRYFLSIKKKGETL
jgi:hypothetical protein